MFHSQVTRTVAKLHIASKRLVCKVKPMNISPLIQPQEALEYFKNPKVRFVDASFHMDKSRNLENEFVSEHIPGAVRFDIDEISDKTSELPHMIPGVETFNNAMNEFGIANDSIVILYGTKNALAVPRVWWTFKLFGHENVAVLDGGIEDWKIAGGAVESGPVASKSNGVSYQGTNNGNLVKTWQEVLTAAQKGNSQIVDARSQARFNGEAAEPRAGLRSGAIPGSLCVPFTSIVSPTNYTKFKSLAELNMVFKSTGIVYGTNAILTCGSGVTASILYFGLHLMGMKMENLAVYDGSWTEWGAKADLPVMVKGTVS